MMFHDVVSATYKGGYQIELTFDNGAQATGAPLPDWMASEEVAA